MAHLAKRLEMLTYLRTLVGLFELQFVIVLVLGFEGFFFFCFFLVLLSFFFFFQFYKLSNTFDISM